MKTGNAEDVIVKLGSNVHTNDFLKFLTDAWFFCSCAFLLDVVFQASNF